MSEETVRFRSGADECVGVLARPDNAKGKLPLVIMAGGWCYTKEIVMPHYSKFFEELGCATLRFDYRCFGESSGSPRQHVDPWAQIEDYRNAISYAETLDFIDPAKIGIWGISYSGGHVLITAAIDPRPAFAISTIPVVDGFQNMRRVHGEVNFARLNKVILDDRRKRAKGEASGYIPMSSEKPHEEVCTWPFPHVYSAFVGLQKTEAPRHEHRNTIESVELLTHYNVQPFCRRIVETPVMMTLAAGDNITAHDLEVEAFNAIADPTKKFASVGGLTHMSIYTDKNHLAKVARIQADWLKGVIG